LASWGIPPPERIWPVAYSVGAESAREVIPFRVSTLRGLRPVLYAGSHIECRLISSGKPGQGTVPFWACLIASVGRFWLTTPHHTFTGVDHSRVLGGVAVSGSTFPSSLPTIDDRSHAAGWRCRPGTWGGRSWCFAQDVLSSHRRGYAVVKDRGGL